MVQIDHLLLKILPLVPKQSEQVTHPRSEIFFGVFKDLRHTLAQLGRALREHQAALQQEGTQLVDHRRSSCDQAVAHTMQRLQIELVICLDRDETHVLSIDSLRDSFCIKEVVLVGLHKWPHELSRNELHVMALFTQSTTKKVRSGTCLQADQRGLQVRCENNQLPLGELLLQQHLAVIAERNQVKGRLTKINPYRMNLHVDDSSLNLPTRSSTLV